MKRVNIRVNKKILVVTLAAALFLCTGAAYALGAFEKRPEPVIGEYGSKFVDQYLAERMSKADSMAIPCYKQDDLLFENECFALGRDAGSYTESGFKTNLFERLVKMFPDPLVRETGDNIYVVYDTDGGARLFVFFSREKNNALFTDGYPVVMKAKLSYENFSKLRVGGSLKDVESIDPVMSLYSNKFDRYTDKVLERNEKAGMKLTSVHLLSDGILKIEYDRAGGGYVITNIAYSPDFILDGLNGKTCYKILDEDYVK